MVVAVEEEIPLNPLLKELEMMEDQEEVVLLVNQELLDQVVLEILPLQVLLKEMMEEQVQILLLPRVQITEALAVELMLLVQMDQLPQEVVLVVLVQLVQ